MTYQEYEHKFRELAEKKGYAEEHILKCLLYAKPLIENKLPIIFNTTHLSLLVGYKKNYIKRAAKNTYFFYRRFEIPKKNGKTRLICEPLPSLKEIQQWILKNILYEIPTSKFAKAYIRKKNILENVEYHKKQKKILNLDIQHFFPSISRESIEKLFVEMGYSNIISNLLSKLCCLEEKLPEGAPTSPYLSNIVLKHLDDVIEIYLKGKKIKYTRYADDLTFSGDDFDEKELIQLVENNLSSLNLKLNHKKTKVIYQHQRQVVTGIVVNEKMQVLKTKRKELRQAIYFIQKFGLKDHLRKINCQKDNYLKHLLGQANFILFINKNDEETAKYKLIIEELILQEENKLLKESIKQIIQTNEEVLAQTDFEEVMRHVPKGIICLLSAALYYDLTTFISSKYHIAIHKKSNIHLPDYPPIELFYWEDEDYHLGLQTTFVTDEELRIYDIEKTVCDAVKHNKAIGKDIALEIIKNYLKRKDRNIVKLSDYARKLGIYDTIMSNLLETLL